MVKVNRKYNKGGALKSVSSKNKGLKKLPKSVRNKMGYMKGGGKSVKVNKKYEDGGRIYGSREEAEKWGSSWANNDSATSDTWPDKTFRYEDENGEIKEVTFTHNKERDRIFEEHNRRMREEKVREEAEQNPLYLKNLEDAYDRTDEESDREYKNGGVTKKSSNKDKDRKFVILNTQEELDKIQKDYEKQHAIQFPPKKKLTDKEKRAKEGENYYKHGGKIKKGKKDEMAIIIAIGRPKANKKSGPKTPIRAKRKKSYDNGGIPIPEDTGTSLTTYNSKEQAESAAQKWASDGLPLKGGKCSMRFGYREVVDGVLRGKIKYVTYTKDSCAESIIKESERKKEQEDKRKEWEESPEGKKSLEKNQASFVKMINEAYEESKRNQ